MSSIKDKYAEQGFYLYKNTVPITDRDALYSSLIKNLCKFTNLDYSEFIELEPWTNHDLNLEMAKFRQEDPMMFGGFYDTMQGSTALFRIIIGTKLESLAHEILEDDYLGTAMTGQMLRMDPPKDDRNSLDWHQESSYYPFNDSGEKGVVCWLPMHDINESQGTIHICPGSHKTGLIEVYSEGKDDTITSEQYRIPAKEISKYESVSVEVNAGDALFFNMDLFHRSGINRSTTFRFAAGARFHRTTTPDYSPGLKNVKLRRRIRSELSA